VLHYGDYQMEIYRAGLNGRLPKLPVDFRELEERAHAAMPPGLVSYVAGGCGNEHTQNINVSAFEHWGLIPRMFVGAAKRDMSIDLFGMRLPTPIFRVRLASLVYARRMDAAISQRQGLRGSLACLWWHRP
jgi:lactate 2-monooxygenase